MDVSLGSRQSELGGAATAVGLAFALILTSALAVRFQSTINELSALERERLQNVMSLLLPKSSNANWKLFATPLLKTKVLQQLVTGNQSIETLLSQLDLEASESNVALESYEPQRPQSAPSTTTARSGSNGNADAPPADPLVTDGVIKQQRLIVVKGAYAGQLEFLRRLERITPLLVISDLSMQGDASSSSADQPVAEATSTMRLTLTAYSKQPAVPKQNAAAKPLAPS